MVKKKYISPGGSGEKKRRFLWLLHQKPKEYPIRPRSNRNPFLKPIHRALQTAFQFHNYRR